MHLARFNWLWHDITSYQPYDQEHTFTSPVVGTGTESRTRAISYVLQTLTANHRELLMLLAEQQLSRADTGAGGVEGLEAPEFLLLCQKSK